MSAHILDIITEVAADAHESKVTEGLEMLEAPHAGSGMGLSGVRKDP